MSCLAGAGALALAPAAGAEVRFEPARSTVLAVGSNEHFGALVAGDFDGDGVEDLAVAVDRSPHGILVLRGDGTGRFIGQAQSPSRGSSPTDIAAADFDDDGDLDVAVAYFFQDGITVHLNAGTGAFPSSSFHPTGENPYQIVAADLNGDGDEDLAVTNLSQSVSQGTVSVLFGSVGGGFGSRQNHPVLQRPAGVAVADYNEDGRPDLAVANIIPDRVSVLPNTGSGMFGAQQSYPGGDFGLAAADADNDGHVDLLNTVFDYNGQIRFLRGAGDGSFGGPQDSADGFSPVWLVAEDFDADGNVDVATMSNSEEFVSVVEGDGTGSFGSRRNYLTPGVAHFDIARGDFNGDGRTDLATVDWGSRTVSVLLNDSSGDRDGDGVPDEADNCPDVPNTEQTDTDGDRQGDVCDRDDDNDGVQDDADDCPGTAAGTQVAADGCPDPDGDGISTQAGDNCPADSNPEQTDTDGDGQGDACDRDDDNDGVEDGADDCRTEPGDAQNGCPLPTRKEQCRDGGWKNYGTTFRNQGDCVSFVATNGGNQPAG